MLSFMSALLGCVGSPEVLVRKSVALEQGIATPATFWIGSRSAAVANSPQFALIARRLAVQFEKSGYQIAESKSTSEYQAYLWFGKRAERREQFSNVTDGISIATEYTWAATLEIMQRQAVGQQQRYLSEVEAAVWCPSIDSVLDELVAELVLDFPAAESYDALVLVPYTPNKC
jgi:hypothetical protein